MLAHEAFIDIQPDVIVSDKPTLEPPVQHSGFRAESAAPAELVTDVEDDVVPPPGMKLLFCSVERSFWHVAVDDPFCPGCGTRRGDIH